eukprot:8574367-Pyramimonas_sp.AAC.2
MKAAGVMSPLFCATLLTRRHRTQGFLLKQIRHYIKENLDIVHSPPDAEQTAHVKSVLGFMVEVLQSTLVDKEKETERLIAVRKLIKFLGGIRGPRIKHYCPFGCHCSKQAAEDDLYKMIEQIFVRHPPQVPAWNKWTKVWPPLL